MNPRIVEVRSLVELAEVALEWTATEIMEPIPKLVLMRGEMGSGKTTFVSKVADVLGAPGAASPSFALHTRYTGIRGSIDHFDLDRLTSAEDLESTGFWDIVSEASQDTVQGPGRFVMIEWAERLEEFGAATDGARWTSRFRGWNFHFEGPPRFRVRFGLLNSQKI